MTTPHPNEEHIFMVPYMGSRFYVLYSPEASFEFKILHVEGRRLHEMYEQPNKLALEEGLIRQIRMVWADMRHAGGL